ncbi:unnamed protein product [Adineta steineri]|uniref:Uncharacterized protein n=1 Tax=Adineta steineri TaxID=433720 RepID=A0A814XFH4_9BILA|nr:unnamed protein product [Adineta steineri]
MIILDNFRLVIFYIIFYFNHCDCSINTDSSGFNYEQESLPHSSSIEKSTIVRRSVSNHKCGNLTCRNGGKCEDQQCQCSDNFMGHDCSIARCGHNWCSQTGGKCNNSNKKKQCHCLRRSGGPDCSGLKCSKGTANGLVCFNGATCGNDSETCNCRSGYRDNGSGCLTQICSNGDLCYTNNGICTATGCKCRSNSTHGSDCSQRACGTSGLICHNGGSCTDNKHCQCLHGWTGVTCTGRQCPGFKNLICSATTCPTVGHAPVCQCPANSKGNDCSGITCGNKGLACYNSGTCNTSSSTCSCLAGFGGADCRAVQCAGHTNLFCYNGGCPRAGHDPEAQCICSNPYTGTDCSQMICSHSALTCYNNGECTNGRTCNCPPGYGGIDCRGLPCGSGFCYNGGECVTNKTTGQMQCVCSGNYTLSDCSAEKCSENGPICYNDGICERDDDGNYTCQCIGEWAGADCSATTCHHVLCYNGGYCDDDKKGKDGCICVDGWLGADCRARSCGSNGLICHNNGLCVVSSNGSSVCQCEHPWFGATCEEQICGTDGLICLNSGVCSLTDTNDTSPTCICSYGFAGDDCSAVVCGSEGNACFNHGYCNETTGICICPPPLTSDDCRGNICGANTTNSIVCQNDGICVKNSDGEWACNCTRGWTGPYCMLNICGDDPSSSLMCAHEGTCVHSTTTGSYSCSCQSQWTGPDCSGMRCQEPDITCYNQVDFNADVCTSKGCDCLNDGYGADCRGVRCGLEPGRCYHGAVCIDAHNSTCSSCPTGISGRDCSMMTCPGVKSGYCFNGGVCINGTTCLCGQRSEWSGVDCSERKCSGNYRCLNGGSCNPKSPKQCGCWFNSSKVTLTDKIVNGFESIPHSWPWVVSIRKRTSNRPLGVPICGGTLISEQYILTAAHCFYETLIKEKKSIDIYLFIIGAHYSTDTHVYSDLVIRLTASMIIIHENYNSYRQTDDIALVKLEEKIHFENIHLGAICLPKESRIYPSDGTFTVAIGWGRLFETAQEGSDTLQQVVLVVEEGQQCNRIKSGSQINTQLCAGSVDSQTNQDTCQGDSGGPLMTRTIDGLWEIVGITSYGKGCGRLNELGIYTRVSMYSNWIDMIRKTLDDYTSRSLDKFHNIFLNSANIFQNYFFILYYIIIIKINQIFFYL